MLLASDRETRKLCSLSGSFLGSGFRHDGENTSVHNLRSSAYQWLLKVIWLLLRLLMLFLVCLT